MGRLISRPAATAAVGLGTTDQSFIRSIQNSDADYGFYVILSLRYATV